jgi:5'-3' exonuclease
MKNHKRIVHPPFIQVEAGMKCREDRFEESCEAEGKIRLGEAGWKARYYQEKMGAPPGQQEEVRGDECV